MEMKLHTTLVYVYVYCIIELDLQKLRIVSIVFSCFNKEMYYFKPWNVFHTKLLTDCELLLISNYCSGYNSKEKICSTEMKET